MKPADDLEPPKGGWKVLEKELPSSWKRPALPAPTPGTAGGTVEAGPGSVVQPQCAQNPGRPYMFYRKINFVDTKPTGLRMSSCLAAMDDCRTDLFSICDQTVESMRQVTDPFTQVYLELRPAIKKLGKEASSDGILYTHRDSKGAVLSWLRLEAQFGWPAFPFRTEEQNLYLVGKQREFDLNVPLATGRFMECFVDDSVTPPSALSGDQSEKDVDKFFARVKQDHSSDSLKETQFHKMYPESKKPFVPTKFKKVTWLMSHGFGDLWDLLYHAKTPELLWDLNKLAGGSFAELVKGEPDPQAMGVSLPKKMEVGTVYDAYCFLEESKKKAVYVLLPTGQTTIADHVLAVFANYDWKGTPEDGKTMTAEDTLVIKGAPIAQMLKFAESDGKEVAKPGKSLDLSKLA